VEGRSQHAHRRRRRTHLVDCAEQVLETLTHTDQVGQSGHELDEGYRWAASIKR
jgi:hypothetical protein